LREIIELTRPYAEEFLRRSTIAEGQTTARKKLSGNARNASARWHQIEFPPALRRQRDDTRMKVARRFVISGRVQGVGFRWFVHDAATREGVAGWVTNLLDGRVEAFVEGDQEAVRRVESALHIGPRSARVERVAAFDEDVTSGLKGFSIR
jgi:acylphosphatase